MKILKVSIYANFAALGYGLFNSYYDLNKKTNKKLKYSEEEFTTKFEEFKNNKENSKYFAQDIKRNNMVKELSEKYFDILVIGGGSAGAGVLMDAFSRGLSCGLIESNDFASGASSKSTKLCHGGIRYLEEAFKLKTPFFDAMNLLKEALVERDFFLNSAPFMNKRIEIQIPAKNFLELNYFYIGAFVYHTFYFLNNFPNLFYTFSGPKISISNTNEKVPCKYYAGWYEGQFWDARQNVLSIITCRADYCKGVSPASFANYMIFKEYLYDKSGQIIGIKAFDKINSKEIEIKAKIVVNCTGVSGDLNIPKDDINYDNMITSARGTTDIMDIKSEKVKPEESEIQYLIRELNKNFPMVSKDEITNSISSTFTGQRPLCYSPNYGDNKYTSIKSTKSISRKHVIYHDTKTGLISLMGGKWTSYRKMGEDVVTKVVEILKMRQEKENKESIESADDKESKEIKEFNIMRSSSAELKLSGEVNFENEGGSNRLYDDEIKFFNHLEKYLVKNYKISSELAKSLVFTYGSNSLVVLNIGQEMNLNVPISENISVLKSEIVYAIRHEMAVRPNDFLCRRAGIAFLNLKAAEESIDTVSDIFATELKWNSSKVEKEKEEAKQNIPFLF